MPGHHREAPSVYVIYTLAFLVGLGCCFLVLAMIGGVALTWADPRDPLGLALLLAGPAAGLAACQFVMRRTGRWGGFTFWLVAPIVCAVVQIASLVLLPLLDPQQLPLWLVLSLPLAGLYLIGMMILWGFRDTADD